MRTGLQQILRENREALVETLTKRLRQSDAPHYQQVSEGLLRGRVERLVDSYLEASAGQPRPFVDFIEQLTEERISEGYYLNEIQSMLSLLSREAWRLAEQHSNYESLVMNLGIVCTTVSEAKDRIAQIYLAHKEQADTEVTQLERRLKELFKGTDASPET
jgi:hypothetical protein